jgi:two-component system NtrC family sensor kinase
MRKDVDTHFLAVRQVLLLGAPGSDLAAVVAAALPLPRYLVHAAPEPAVAVQVVTRTKVEVVVYGVDDGDEAARAVEQIRAADPDVELVLVVEERDLTALPAALLETVDLVTAPVGARELGRRVERARERRFLLRGEERRKRAEARVVAIMDAVPSGIISVADSAEATIHDWNPAAGRIFGWPQAAALGRGLWQLVAPDAERSAFCDGEGRPIPGRHFEVTARHQSGRRFPVAMSVAALPLADRPMLAVIVEDRTEAHRLEVELRQAQRLEAVGQLAAGLAHEINTPCQYIGSSAAAVASSFTDVGALLGRYGALARAGERGAVDRALLSAIAEAERDADLEAVLAETPRQLQAIEEGARRIAGIVRSLGDFTGAHFPHETGSVDLNRSLRSILSVLEHELRPVADLEVDEQPLPAVYGHGHELNQALFNIVRNAIEAIGRRGEAERRRGKLVVRTRAEDATVVVAVADSGDGIPEAIRDRIFDPFFTTKEVGRGSGQGLSAAWNAIVERHGGSLTFDSNPTLGTTFHIRLPLNPQGFLARARQD